MRFGFLRGAAGEGRSPQEMVELAVLAEQSQWDGMFLDLVEPVDTDRWLRRDQGHDPPRSAEVG